jgi:hypothetical protein
MESEPQWGGMNTRVFLLSSLGLPWCWLILKYDVLTEWYKSEEGVIALEKCTVKNKICIVNEVGGTFQVIKSYGNTVTITREKLENVSMK